MIAFLLQNLGYITGEVHGDEIEAVLSYLFMEIDYQFYKNESYTDIDERAIEKKRKDALKERISEENGDNGNEVKKPIRRPGSHIRHGCQACQQKVCTKKVSKPYAGVPEVNTN